MQNNSTFETVESKQTGISRWGGLFLVLIGGALFVSRVLGIELENWWALFILMPALVMFGVGWMIPRRENGRFSFFSRLFFAAGLVVLVVAGMFLVNLDWSVWWPLMIVAPGAGLIIAGGRQSENPTAAAWIGYFRWISLSLMGLGGVFLAHTLGMIHLQTFGEFHWWGVFVAFTAMGALLQAVRLYGRLGYPDLHVIILLLIAFFSGVTAVIELLGIPWTSFFGITAVFFMGSGLILVWHGLRSANE
jgi:hypothetical protein